MVGTSVVEMKEEGGFVVVGNLAVAIDVTVTDPKNQDTSCLNYLLISNQVERS